MGVTGGIPLKKALSLILVLTLFALLLALGVTAAAADGEAADVSFAGSGTEENPFLIGTLEELIFSATR